MEFRISEEAVIEQPVVESDEDTGWHKITVIVDSNTYEVKFPESRRDDIVFGLGRIAEALQRVGV